MQNKGWRPLVSNPRMMGHCSRMTSSDRSQVIIGIKVIPLGKNTRETLIFDYDCDCVL